MLRLIFVFGIILTGLFYAQQGPFYALLLYLWDGYFRPEQWVWNPGLITVLHLSLVVGGYVVLRTITSAPRWRFNGRTSLLFLFLAQAAVGTVTSEHFDGSLAYLNQFSRVLLVCYLIVVLVDDRKRFRLALTVIAWSLGFEAAKQGWVNLIRHPGGLNTNPIPFLGDNNGVAMGMMMLTPIFVALAQAADRPRERFLSRFMSVGTFMRGITTYSRGGFLGGGVVGLFIFLRSKHKVQALVGIAVLAVLVSAVMPQTFWDRMHTIVAPASDYDNSSEGRLHFWDVAVVMAESRPLTGVGLDGFNSSYDTYNSDPSFGGGRAAHSSWFGVLGDLGYPGLLLLIANLAGALWSCWRVQRLTRNQPARRELNVYANGLMTSLLAFVVTGTFLSMQYNEMMWHLVAFSTALHFITVDELAVPAAAAVRATMTAPERRPETFAARTATR